MKVPNYYWSVVFDLGRFWLLIFWSLSNCGTLTQQYRLAYSIRSKIGSLRFPLSYQKRDLAQWKSSSWHWHDAVKRYESIKYEVSIIFIFKHQWYPSILMIWILYHFQIFWVLFLCFTTHMLRYVPDQTSVFAVVVKKMRTDKFLTVSIISVWTDPRTLKYFLPYNVPLHSPIMLVSII